MAEPRRIQREKESPASRPDPSRPAPTEETEQLVVTINARTGETVKVEKVDKAGKRHELSEEETAKLAGEDDDDGDDDGEERQVLRLLLGGRMLRRRRLRRLLLARLLRDRDDDDDG